MDAKKKRNVVRRHKNQQKAFANAKAKADDIRLQYKLPVESVYIDLIIVDVYCVYFIFGFNSHFCHIF